MYPCYQDKIVDGKTSFPMASIIGENLLFVALWVISGYLLWPIWKPLGLPLLTVLWVILVVVIQIYLKKHNCSGCYYYDKACHLGWGKIASAMFKQESGDPKTGTKLTLFYIIPPPLILLGSLAYAIINHPAAIYWIFLVLFFILNAISFPIRKKSCGLCVMREICPGSAVKSKQPA